MATTLAQAFELKKKDPKLSTRDAIAQVEGNVGTQALQTPTPAPVTPPATPPQTQTGVNGETFQVAPVNAQGLSTPAQPTAPQ